MVLVHDAVDAVLAGLAGVFKAAARKHRAHVRDGQRLQALGRQVVLVAVDVEGHDALLLGGGHLAPALDAGQAGVLLVVQLGQLVVAALVLAQIVLPVHHGRLQLAGHGLQVTGGLAGDQFLQFYGHVVHDAVQLVQLRVHDVGQQLLVVVLDLLSGVLQVV